LLESDKTIETRAKRANASSRAHTGADRATCSGAVQW